MMKRGIGVLGWMMVGVLATGVSSGGNSGEVNAALKQISKTTKGIRGVVAEVEWAETVGKRSVNGSGTLHVSFAGVMRVDIEGDAPATVIFSPPFLYIHRKTEQVVEIYDVTSNPHRLGQYLILGFVPNGKALKERFKVQMVANGKLDGREILNFLITPKSQNTAHAIARIQLWVDPATGLPAKHEVVHASGESRLAVRYLSMTRDDDLPATLFQPEWPAGTKTIHK
jgi:outer membrane lipoprotein-sorting protein